ncbi:MAG: hypothetical protein K8F91_23640 [Candidatus Obscuribacterales bacterium]|nr:hypothetical protein [Candidatus Obscuribacterales bacterium]
MQVSIIIVVSLIALKVLIGVYNIANARRPVDSTVPSSGDKSQDSTIPTGSTESSYFEKLIRYIPGELVAGYLALDGLLRDDFLANSIILYWFVFVALLALTPFYVVFRPNHQESVEHSRRFHAVVATVSFMVWVFALGGPFAATWPDAYRPIYGSVFLIITTLSIPVVEKISLRAGYFR